MSTVLVVEDQFLASYELECVLNERGYEVRHAATQSDAIREFHKFKAGGQLAAVVCDNRLIDGVQAAASFYRHVRAWDTHMPFIIYSGFPPADLLKDDPRLKTVRKPFIEQVVSYVRAFAPAQGKSRASRARMPKSEAA